MIKMLRKIVVLFFLLTSISFYSWSQPSVGQWEVYPTRSTEASVIFDSGDDLVYYMSGNNLFSYDQSSNEIESYNTGNYLSDSKIKNIYYNYLKNYLMIVYENSNIDLIYSDKRVVNIPDLKNTIMMSSKSINDVVFDADRIYVATDFGLMIINDEKYEIYESYMYDKALTKVAIAGNTIFIVADGQLYKAAIVPGMYEFDSNWTVVDLTYQPQNFKYLYRINDEHIFLSYDEKSYVYDIEKNSFTEQTEAFAMLFYALSLTETKTGFLATFTDNIRFISSDVTDDDKLVLVEQKNLKDSSVKGGYCSSYNDERTVWCSSAAGLSHFSIEGTTFTWLMEPSFYNTSNVTTPHIIQIHDNKVYVKNSGQCFFTVNQTDPTQISILDCTTREWQTLTLDNVIYDGNSNRKGALRSSYNISFSPSEEDVIFIGSWFDGLHKFKGSEYVGNYNQYNSPLRHPYAMAATNSDFDTDGNLWAELIYNSAGSTSILGCLPKEKNILSPDQTTESDWITYDIGFNSSVGFFSDLLVARKSSFCFVVQGATLNPTRLTVVNRSSGETRIFSQFTDQDGSSVGSGILNFKCAAEDMNGSVWLGTTSGPIVLNNISNIMNTNYRCTRVKVPRNDGTDYADYLLEDETINAIVVDGANRKWLGTANSGVYLVSEDGTEILQQYTTDNSLLPSNCIYSMAINDETGELFVATDAGVASYRSDVSNASDDYSNVYAFPNPVRPDYSGWITISGLMENSLVKITDVAGNLFYETYSNGGTVTWDGRTRDGARVKTGVYLVYASQSGGSSGVVTKIMVVN